MVLGLSTGVSLTGLVQALDRDFPGRGAALANGLLAGASEITSAEHGYRLMELAKTVQMDKSAMMYFTAEPFRPSAWKDEIPAGSQFCKEFEKFLKDYGHRGVYEAELLNPRWGEDPGYLLEIIRANALVMEVGGYLSHGAIVAREYGIPAVVNVPGVMKALKDGEHLTVDGDEGKVYRG